MRWTREGQREFGSGILVKCVWFDHKLSDHGILNPVPSAPLPMIITPGMLSLSITPKSYQIIQIRTLSHLSLPWVAATNDTKICSYPDAFGIQIDLLWDFLASAAIFVSVMFPEHRFEQILGLHGTVRDGWHLYSLSAQPVDVLVEFDVGYYHSFYLGGGVAIWWRHSRIQFAFLSFLLNIWSDISKMRIATWISRRGLACRSGGSCRGRHGFSEKFAALE